MSWLGRHFTACALVLAFAVSGDRGAAAKGGGKETAEATTQKSAAAEEKEHAKPTEVKLSKEAVEENEVKAEPVGKRVLVPTFEAPGRVAFDAEAMARIGAPLAGRVAEFKAKLGDAVHHGDALLVVESPDLGEAQSDYLQKRTALDAATAAVEPAKVAYERGKQLYDQNQGIALSELQKREAELKAARAGVRAAEAAAAGARNKLSLRGMDDAAVEALEKTGALTPRYVVRTPIDGQVIQCDVTLGQLVAPDKELALTVADMSRVWVLADVPEAEYARLKSGAKAVVTVAALPDERFEGVVKYIAPALDAASRTAQARVEVNNEHGLLRPGMFARCRIAEPAAATTAEPVLAVPDEAVQRVEDETVVFVPVEGKEGEFAKREVKVGEAVGGWVPVREGLREGESVVTHGAEILKAQLAKPAAEE
jgi:cobalt-zinc-cadmium efflux system membrane fusion protein